MDRAGDDGADRRRLAVVALAGLSGAALVSACTTVQSSAASEATVVAPSTHVIGADVSTTPAPTVAAATTAPADTAPPTAPQASVPATTTTVAPDPPPGVDRMRSAVVSLEPWVDLPLLTAMVTHPADGSAYLASQTGEVWRVAGDDPELVLDLTSTVSPYEPGSERGLLGLGFGPVDGRLYVSYTDASIDSHVDSYEIDEDGHPIAGSLLEVIVVEQPGLGHKGGGLAFEPDGTLYLTLGDGGASNGRDAQDMAKLLGGIVRLRPRPSGGYDVPADNPFVGVEGIAPEIWAKGLRNPWGFCRDTATGTLWWADVGNNTMEEIDRLAAGAGGANFGWPFLEGTERRRSGAPDDAVPPVFTYLHGDVGPAAIGGCVYRGSAIPELRGAYLFGDLSGPLFALGDGDEVVELSPRVSGVLTGFGIDGDGELVVLTLQQGAFRLVAG